jgi:hypothetical protein
MRPDELERRLRDRLDGLPPAARAELLHVLMLPDFERADRIGEFWGYPQSRAFAELLVDCEEDRTLRAVLVGMLREPRSDRKGYARPQVARPGSAGPTSRRHVRRVHTESARHRRGFARGSTRPPLGPELTGAR